VRGRAGRRRGTWCRRPGRWSLSGWHARRSRTGARPGDRRRTATAGAGLGGRAGWAGAGRWAWRCRGGRAGAGCLRVRASRARRGARGRRDPAGATGYRGIGRSGLDSTSATHTPTATARLGRSLQHRPDRDRALQPGHERSAFVDHRPAAPLHRRDRAVQRRELRLDGRATARAAGRGVRGRATRRARVRSHSASRRVLHRRMPSVRPWPLVRMIRHADTDARICIRSAPSGVADALPRAVCQPLRGGSREARWSAAA
jgi:hypothetical protein